MSAIVTAVNSSAISRLNLTSDLIQKDVKNTLKNLSKILEPKDNFRAYRTVLKEGRNDACIPIFGAILSCNLQSAIDPPFSCAHPRYHQNFGPGARDRRCRRKTYDQLHEVDKALYVHDGRFSPQDS